MGEQQSQGKKLVLIFGILFILVIVIIVVGFLIEKLGMTDQEKFILQPILENDNIPTVQEKQLVEAAWNCDKETMISLLSDNKLNIDAKNKFGTTALMAVSQMGCSDLVKLLIEKYGPNVNIENFYGRTALMLADYSSFDTMQILLLSGADVYIKNKCCGATTLMLVAGTGYVDVIKLLINYGADVNVKDNEGKTAIDYAKESFNSNRNQVIQLLQNEAQQN